MPQQHSAHVAAALTRRQFVGAAAAVAASAAIPLSAQSSPAPYRSFKPGQPWLDTAGKPIQTHGGSVLYHDDKFYWYGENKEFTTGKTDVWTWGVRCYSSTDLYNWQDLGLIIPPDTQDPSSPLHPAQLLDRPHILHNRQTGKFVCWVKLMSKTSVQTRTVLVADAITGPYKIVQRDIRPLGMNAGDYDLVASPADGKAYMYFERVHSEMICADLTDDYTGFTGYYSTHFPHIAPPFFSEGPAYFYRQGKHYLASSGTSGYFPNPSEIAVADTFHGPFTVLGDLHPSDRSRTSFNSQISSIFKHPGKKDLYIAIADRWMGPLSGPEFESGHYSQVTQSIFRKLFSDPREPFNKEESDLMTANLTVDTTHAPYVWLPVFFKEGRPVIEWRSEWTLDEFA